MICYGYISMHAVNVSCLTAILTSFPPYFMLAVVVSECSTSNYGYFGGMAKWSYYDLV